MDLIALVRVAELTSLGLLILTRRGIRNSSGYNIAHRGTARQTMYPLAGLLQSWRLQVIAPSRDAKR